jgi:aconitate hydratase
VVASVLSGNRNFEGRINPHVRANYLASPPLVVAYAIAGTVDFDFDTEPLGVSEQGEEVYLRDIWPRHDEIVEYMNRAVKPETFRRLYEGIERSNEEWNKIPVRGGDLFEWDTESTYIQEPPFFTELTPEVKPIQPITGARALAKLGDPGSDRASSI